MISDLNLLGIEQFKHITESSVNYVYLILIYE